MSASSVNRRRILSLWLPRLPIDRIKPGSIGPAASFNQLRLDPETSRIRVYGVRDGLLSQEFNDRPMGVSRDGHFAAGTGDGRVLRWPLATRGGAPAVTDHRPAPVPRVDGGQPLA